MIYIDAAFKCHTENSNDYRGFDVPFFYDKCKTFIEGYMYIPHGESITNKKGVTYRGEMIAPWKDYNELDNAQREYERQLLAEYEAALSESVPLSDLTAAYQEGVNAAYDQE